MKHQPRLRLQKISKQYPGVRALDEVSFDVEPGEVHAVVGENGAGKSTLIKIVTGAIEASSGEIYLEGELVAQNNPIAAKRAGIGCIYQEFNLVPYLTVAENIFLGREPVKNGLVDYERMVRESEGILARLGIKLDARLPVEKLSVGFQQIVEIAKALSEDVKILIMDEPSAPLTNRELEALFSMVKTLRDHGVSVVYISHRLEEVFELADRVTVLRDGEYIQTLSVPDTSQQELIRLMVGRELATEYPRSARTLGEPVLEVRELVNERVKGVSLQLRRGEILGIAGLVGAGRTEVARAIFGADTVDSGTVTLNGELMTISSPAEAIAAGIGLIPEDRKQHGILGLLTVRENITFTSLGAFIRRLLVDRRKERETAQEMSRRLRIKTPTLENLMLSLSGGNQQKVVLAKTLLTDSQVILFDEPTRGIDVGAKREIYNLMDELASRGKALLMISSEMPELLGMADRILVMSEGRIVRELGRDEFSQEAILTYASMASDGRYGFGAEPAS
jgi:ribose transport system ATP-binding protein